MKQVYLNQSALHLDPKSPWVILVKITLSVFFAEAFLMLVLSVLPKLPDLVEAFVDATLLSVLVAPALYVFVYQPLTQEISQRCWIEAELRQSQADLQQQTQELEKTYLVTARERAY